MVSLDDLGNAEQTEQNWGVMTEHASEGVQPNMSLRKPWWVAVLLAMLGFGLMQEQSKIKVNHYLQVGDTEQFWNQEAHLRKTWWEQSAPLGRHNFYVSRETWDVFHHFDRSQLIQFKWGLSAVILLIFFALDVLFLRATGVAHRVPWLVLIYLTAGVPMVGLGWSVPGESWYALARDMLGFLQSPLPSVLVVLVPWFLSRMAKPREIG